MSVLTPTTVTEFNAASLTRRQNTVFDAECQCTKAMHAEYRGRYESAATRPRTLVIDGTTFRWEGLGNSGTRWMGLLRWGFATGRQVYLQIGRDCQSPKAKAAMVPCRMDIGAYFTGYNGVDWHWGTQAAAVRKRHTSRGERPLVIQCVRARRACMHILASPCRGAHRPRPSRLVARPIERVHLSTAQVPLPQACRGHARLRHRPPHLSQWHGDHSA